MKAIILIELDEDHLLKQTNDLYDRLKGYKCVLRPLPQEKEILECDEWVDDDWDKGYVGGWNACLEEITGETE